MDVDIIGEGEPGVAVIGSIHGDEPCGKKAIDKFKNSDFELERPVKLIIANEKALKNNTRYVDCDLNRSFPGNRESDEYEERLAAEIMDEVDGLDVLSLHSTKSYSGPFAAMSELNERKIDLVKKTGVRIASYHANEEIYCLAEYSNTVSVECGFQGSESAAENAFRIMKNFLAAEGVIDLDYRISDPDVFKVYETIERPDFEFTAVNFQKVEEGEIYARNGNKELTADESFYPVLMSTDGYKTILGHKARKLDSPTGYTKKQT